MANLRFQSTLCMFAEHLSLQAKQGINHGISDVGALPGRQQGSVWQMSSSSFGEQEGHVTSDLIGADQWLTG